MRLLNGTVSVVDAVTLAGAFTQQGGTLDGAGTLTLAGPVVWNAGTQRGTGPGERTIVTGGLEMTSGTRVLSGRTLVLESHTQWTGGNWQIRGGATIVNRPGAVLAFANTWLDDTDPNTTDTLINEGTLRKNASTGAATFEPGVVNRGTIEIEVGKLHVHGALIQESGSLALAGGNIQSDVLFDIRGGQVTGSGQLQGNVRNAGYVRPGETSRVLRVAGNFEQTATGVVEIQWGGVSAAHDLLEITGTANLAGTLRVIAVDGFVPELQAVLTPVEYRARTGEFSSVQALLGAGRGAVADYLPTVATVTVVESDVTDADIARQHLNFGTDVLRDRLAGWSQLMGLPDNPLPLIGNGFDQALDLATEFLTTAQAGLPAITQEVLSYEALRTALQDVGLTVICIAGEAGCENGVNVLVRFDHTLEDLTTEVPVESLTPGVLQGLADAWSLNGSLSIQTDVQISIVLGVDASGFFLDGSSRITLANFTIDGSVHGTGDIGGAVAIMLAGVANASGDFTLDLLPVSAEGRYRTDALWTDSRNFLRVDVAGDAHLALDFAIGPAVMTWEGLYQVTTDDVHAIDVQLDEMLLSGQVSLPELKQVVHGVPQDGFVTIDAVYQSGTGTWHIDATAETSDIYQLGGLTIRQLDFDADIGPNLLDGDFSALMEVPFGETEDPLVIDIDLNFNSRELSGMIEASFAERYVGGTLLWLQGVQLTTNVDVQFDPQSLAMDFTTTADRAILFVDSVEAPGVAPTGVVTLTGFTGTLSRQGVLDFRIDEAVAEFPAFTITSSATGNNPAMHLVIDP